VPPTDDPLPALADRAELGRVLEEHRPALLAMLRRRIDPALGGRLDADDILGDVAQAACRRWAWFKGQSAVGAYVWLYGLARERLIDAWRRHAGPQRDHHRDQPWPDHSSVQLGLRLVAPGTAPSAAAARAEDCERVRQAMGLLRTADRDILWMRQADGLSFREAAAVLGVTENAATVRYARALRKLKDLWQQLYGTGGTGS
jgi:RNA polymerase sigma-70 factor (ECF subfamily)